MTEMTENKYDLLTELKAIFLMFFVIIGFAFVPKERLLIFALITTGLLLVVERYIDRNELSLADKILNIFMAFYNVASLFYVVQYFADKASLDGIYGYVFYPFINNEVLHIGYVIWIFILTLFILILRMQAGKSSGEKYGR